MKSDSEYLEEILNHLDKIQFKIKQYWATSL
jgi:hypothetical protein